MARGRKTKVLQSNKTAKSTPSRTYSLGDRLNWQSIQTDWEKSTKNFSQNSFSLVLGALIVIVLAVLVFNFFNKPTPTTSPQTSSSSTQQSADVSKDNLPGKYTVKDGDTLYDIAQKYYNNGYLFPQIAQANNLTDSDLIQVGQVLEIPKLSASALATPTPTPSETPTTEQTAAVNPATQPVQGGTGGPTNMTAWGEAITGTTYTVVEGDWLSKIAGRAYGDIYSYPKIAQANNIANPNLIEPGMVLTIPR